MKGGGGGFRWLDFRPVLERELREGARRPATRRLRLAAASGSMILLWLVASTLHLPGRATGPWIFVATHALLLGFIALSVPAMAGDSLAQEKREETLALLSLTPLSAGGVVTAKALAVVLRMRHSLSQRIYAF